VIGTLLSVSLVACNYVKAIWVVVSVHGLGSSLRHLAGKCGTCVVFNSLDIAASITIVVGYII
jgi:hypothetical protein